MSFFDYAVQYTLESEGVFSNDRNDRGGKTKYGITEGTLREYQRKDGKLRGITIEELTRGEAIQIYKAVYWRFDGLVSRMIATKLFDMGVNFGLGQAVKIAQSALTFIGHPVTVDGLWGSQTRTALNVVSRNRFARLMLFKAMVYFAAQRYVLIVAGNESQLDFIDGWLARAARRPAD